MASERAETVIDLPWDVVDACNGFGIDIGKYEYVTSWDVQNTLCVDTLSLLHVVGFYFCHPFQVDL